MNITTIELVVGVRFSGFELFKLALKDIPNFREHIQCYLSGEKYREERKNEHIRCYLSGEKYREERKNITLENINEMLEMLKYQLSKCELGEGYEVDEFTGDLLDQSLCDLADCEICEISTSLKPFKMCHDVDDSHEFIVGILVDDRPILTPACGKNIDDMISELKNVTEKVVEELKELGWIIDEKPELYMVCKY